LPDHLHHHVACRSGGVNRLGQTLESRFRLAQPLYENQYVAERARKPVQLPDDEHITLAELIEQTMKFRPVPPSPGGLLTVDLFAAGRFQRRTWVAVCWSSFEFNKAIGFRNAKTLKMLRSLDSHLNGSSSSNSRTKRREKIAGTLGEAADRDECEVLIEEEMQYHRLRGYIGVTAEAVELCEQCEGEGSIPVEDDIVSICDVDVDSRTASADPRIATGEHAEENVPE
jgi:hypothetical protein